MVEIPADERLPLVIDGESRGELPVRFSIKAGALKVIGSDVTAAGEKCGRRQNNPSELGDFPFALGRE